MAYMTTMSLTEKTRSIIRVFEIQPRQAKFVELLLENEAVSDQKLIDEGVAPNKNTVRSQASKLRKRLEKLNAHIFNVRESGYWLTPEGKETINDRLTKT